MKRAFIALALFSVASLSFAALETTISAINGLCTGLTSMLPVAAMLMTMLAAVIYAAGQIMGAETRARANVWATAAVTGAMMAVLISIVSPSVLGMIYGAGITCAGGSGGGPLPAGSVCTVGVSTCAAPSTCRVYTGSPTLPIPSGTFCLKTNGNSCSSNSECIQNCCSASAGNLCAPAAFCP